MMTIRRSPNVIHFSTLLYICTFRRYQSATRLAPLVLTPAVSPRSVRISPIRANRLR
jgi:hypothetical protein